MRKGLLIFSAGIVLILMLSAFTSALTLADIRDWFGGIFGGGVTGNIVESVDKKGNVKCIDYDGNNIDGGIYDKSTTLKVRLEDNVVQNIRADKCSSKSKVKEFYCDARGKVRSKNVYCALGCNDDACIRPKVTEDVTCVFSNAKTEQKCYVDSDAIDTTESCSGIGSCIAKVSGLKGYELNWKSTCSGYASILLDGKAEKIQFNCMTSCVDSDGGNNYGVNGIATEYEGKNVVKIINDSCIDSKVLSEAVCLNNLSSSVSYSCKYGCKSEICLAQPPEPFDFSLSIYPENTTIKAGYGIGSNIFASLKVSLISGTTQQVNLSYNNCPPASSCSFDILSGFPSYTSFFNLKTTSSTPAGSYKINITGKGGGKARTTSFNLIAKGLLCIDSDSGKNYYTTGNVTAEDSLGDFVSYADKCVIPKSNWLYDGYYAEQNGTYYDYIDWYNDACEGDNCYVAEAYCTAQQIGDLPPVTFDVYKCPNGCKNGACILGSGGGGSGGGGGGGGFVNLYLNDSINKIKSDFTSLDLPTVLSNGTFSGNVEANYFQKIVIGGVFGNTGPRLVYDKGPTSSFDPDFVLSMSTNPSNYLYNATITFNKAIDFTHVDTKGKKIVLFSREYIIDDSTTSTKLVLLSGIDKITLLSSGAVTKDDVIIDGARVNINGGINSASRITISVTAPNSDKDALHPGESFIDPVFGSFRINFADLNIANNHIFGRENIEIKNLADDRMGVTFTDSRGYTLSDQQFAVNRTGGASIELQHDTEGKNISVFEAGEVFRNEMLMVGNKDDGRLLKLTQVYNDTGTSANPYSKDKIKFQDVFSGDSYEATITGEGSGTVTIGGKVYNINYFGASSASEDTRYVRVNQPDSSGAGVAVIYPTISTSKEAKLFFYEPLTIQLDNWDGNGNALTTLKFPNGNGYTDVSTGIPKTVSLGPYSFVTYNITYAGINKYKIYLISPRGGNIVNPAIVIFEEKDDRNVYEAVIITLEPGGNVDDGLGVDQALRTWGNDQLFDEISVASNIKLKKEADRWGTIITIDSSDSDQKTATISYPDEQIYSLLSVVEKIA